MDEYVKMSKENYDSINMNIKELRNKNNELSNAIKDGKTPFCISTGLYNRDVLYLSENDVKSILVDEIEMLKKELSKYKPTLFGLYKKT